MDLETLLNKGLEFPAVVGSICHIEVNTDGTVSVYTMVEGQFTETLLTERLS